MTLAALGLGLAAPAAAISPSWLVLSGSTATQYLSGSMCLSASTSSQKTCTASIDGKTGNVYGNGQYLSGIPSTGTVPWPGSCPSGEFITGTSTVAAPACAAVPLGTFALPGSCIAGQYVAGTSTGAAPTCGTPSGSGDALLAADQTWTGHNTYNETMTVASNVVVGQTGSTNTVKGVLLADSFVGMFAYFIGASCPVGWLPANGSTALATGYTAALAAQAGTTYGTYGTLPNVSGRFIRATGGNAAARGVAQADAIQGHYHSVNDPGHAHIFQFQDLTGGTLGSWPKNEPNVLTLKNGETQSSTTGLTVRAPSTDGTNGTPRTAAETRPANIALTACVKY